MLCLWRANVSPDKMGNKMNTTATAANMKTNEPQLPSCDHKPKKYEGPSREEALSMRREFLTPALLTYYKNPIMIVEGWMQWLFDEKGRRYLDGLAGIVTVSVGHSHPKVVDALKEQCEKLQHATTIYLHPTIGQFGKELAATFPKGSGLGVTYFVNSGSEANDLAILTARIKTGAFDVIGLRNAYHGTSPHIIGLTALKTWKYPTPQGFGMHHARLPDMYRGPYGADDPDAGRKYAEEVADIIRHSTPGRVAAFIAEPIQGVGGTVPMPAGYLRHVYAHVREAGGLCISDEVQTGFGRTGDYFWGFESHGVTPDIVTMAKGIGNGAALAAMTTRADVADCLTQRLHFNTYGGNPMSMAAGLATLCVIKEEKIQQRAKTIGAYLKDGLNELKSRHTCVGDVRGQGLMLGMELVEDQETKEPSPTKTAAVHERAKDLGLLVGKGGLYGNVLRIKPPMCITKEDCEFLCKVLDIALTEVERG